MAVALVTGGSRGIGEAICRRLSEDGYTVAVNYCKDSDKAEAVASEIGGKAYKADVSNYGEVCEMFSAIERELGAPEILVNNAAISVVGVFQDCSDEEWDRIFGINVKGVFNCCKRAVGNMLQRQHGSIINISSIWGITGGSCECHYSAAKAAVKNFTEFMAVHFADVGIRVNSIAPGFFSTNQNKALLWNEDGTPTARTGKILAATPMKRFGEPQELEGSLLFLCDETYSSFITGTTIAVDGGFNAYSGV